MDRGLSSVVNSDWIFRMWTHSRVVCMKMGKEALRRGEETGKEREAGTGREERSQGGEGKRARGSREERGGEDPQG